MSTYIGLLQIGSTGEQMPIGSTLFGYCDSTANTTTKKVTLNAFDSFARGVTIHIRFNNGNTAIGTTANPIVLSIGALVAEVAGNFVCESNTVVEFTYDEVDATHKYWRVNGTYIDADAYATAAQGTLAENAMPKSGGEFSGNVTFGSGTTLTIPTIGNDSNNNAAATKKYVDDKVAGVLAGEDAMVFKGTIGAAADNPTIQTLPNGTSGQIYMAGDTYRVITAGTYAGEVCEVGDLIIAIASSTAGQSEINNSHWTIAQTNIDGAVIGPASSTAQHVAIFNNATGKEIEDSGFTLGKSVPSEAVFTDTTYAITDGRAYTAHTLTDAEGATILASVVKGVLTLAPGIQFTTSNVGSTLTPTVNGANT